MIVIEDYESNSQRREKTFFVRFVDSLSVLGLRSICNYSLVLHFYLVNFLRSTPPVDVGHLLRPNHVNFFWFFFFGVIVIFSFVHFRYYTLIHL